LSGEYGVSQLHPVLPCTIEGCIKKADLSSSYQRNTKNWNCAFSSGPSTDHRAFESCLLLTYSSSLLRISRHTHLFHSAKVCYVTLSVLSSAVLMCHGTTKTERALSAQTSFALSLLFQQMSWIFWVRKQWEQLIMTNHFIDWWRMHISCWSAPSKLTRSQKICCLLSAEAKGRGMVVVRVFPK